MEDRVWVEAVSEVPVAAVRVRLAPQDIPRSFRASLDKVWSFLGKEPGLRTDGHNIFIYHRNHDADGDGKIDIDFGVQVARNFAGVGDVISTTSPAGRAAVSKHVGAYDRLGEAHAAVRRWCAANGCALAGVDWEVYGDWNDDQTKLETHVYYLLQ
jgi:effector-binding domain-containing protein